MPTLFPEQEPLYQYQFAEVPKLPPLIPNVVEMPSQIVVSDDVVESAETEFVLTEIVILTHPVVLQVPSALTKYSVVTIGDIFIVEPFPSFIPPHEREYQFHIPPVPAIPPETLNEVEVPSQIVDDAVVTEPAAIGTVLTTT